MTDPLGQMPGPDPEFWRGIRYGVLGGLAAWMLVCGAAFGLVVLLAP